MAEQLAQAYGLGAGWELGESPEATSLLSTPAWPRMVATQLTGLFNSEIIKK